MTRLSTVLLVFAVWLAGSEAHGTEPWETALSRMPLRTNVVALDKTNAIPLLLASFQQNDAAKALVFMPGATDEFYFFNRGHAWLTNATPTLLDALLALTNQTLLRVTFRAPFLLVHSAEDPLEAAFAIHHAATAERLRQRSFARHAIYNDRDWDSLLPTLRFHLDVKLLPEAQSQGSWHFYRHSFAAWNLTAWEALQAIALAGKTTFRVEKRRVVFEGDKRFRSRPPVPILP